MIEYKPTFSRNDRNYWDGFCWQSKKYVEMYHGQDPGCSDILEDEYEWEPLYILGIYFDNQEAEVGF